MIETRQKAKKDYYGDSITKLLYVVVCYASDTV